MGGSAVIWEPSPRPENPSQKGRSCNNTSAAMNVVLYTRAGCHLCDDAEQVLLAHGLLPTLIDVDGDAALCARWGECVPVVEIDGRVRFRGRVDARLLRRILAR